MTPHPRKKEEDLYTANEVTWPTVEGVGGPRRLSRRVISKTESLSKSGGIAQSKVRTHQADETV